MVKHSIGPSWNYYASALWGAGASGYWLREARRSSWCPASGTLSLLRPCFGAQHGERSLERVTGEGGGDRNRTWDTRVGTMELHIPKLREGSYFPSLLEPRRRSEKALLSVIQQAYVEGVSTRRAATVPMKSPGLRRHNGQQPGVARLRATRLVVDGKSTA